MTRYQFRPISTWPGEMTRPGNRRKSPFRAGHDRTMEALSYELGLLNAKDVVVELALREADIRIDGMPRATAKPPEHPGVILSFDSDYGPLRYACDAFLTWPHNLRAIALGLEHLRAVDRYGITKRGEQYAGWKALEAPGKATSAEDARATLWAIIDKHGSEAQRTRDDDLEDYRLVRRARRITHPDMAPVGVPESAFFEVQEAAAMLGVA